MKNKKSKIIIAYIGIIAVVFIWAVIPLLKKAIIGNSFSATVYTTVSQFAAAFALLCMYSKHTKSISRDYFKIGVPTGVCVGVASLCQALAYNFNASPTNQAFLENLSCITVPIILLVVLKKAPTVLAVSASLLCLLSSVVLSGAFSNGMSFGAADILNALAGMLYGVNIAITGIYAKKFNAPVYVMIQLFVQAVMSLLCTVAFNFICIGTSPIDTFVFSSSVWLTLAVVAIGIISNALCWTMRTSAMKYVSANVVAVFMPFSAVITGIIAVLIGQDKPTLSLMLGALLGIVASLMSSIADILENKKSEKKASTKE